MIGHARSNFVDFTLGGEDEKQEALAEGEATLDGGRLTFELWRRRSDEYIFERERPR